MKIIPVILCGGSGTRLWPESREDSPKQFLNLIDDQSLLQNTISRALRVADANIQDVVCVCLDSLADKVLSQIKQINPNAKGHILQEPSARNTAAAVALAASYCRSVFGEESLLWILPSDHYIGKESILKKALQTALGSAMEGHLVTFGITPTRPETGYGYIRCSDFAPDAATKAERFIEKPDMVTASSFLDEGAYFWNSGMFLFRTATVLDAFSLLSANILKAVEASMEKSVISNGNSCRPDPSLYAEIPKIPFDKAIMEKSPNVTVIPCDMAWSDVGTWGSIWEISSKTSEQNAVQGNVVLEQSSGCLVRSNSGRLIACAGVEDLVVIDTPDAVLVTRRSSPEPLEQMIRNLNKKPADTI